MHRLELETDRKFDEALKFIEPFMIIEGRPQPEVPREEKVETVNKGMRLLREVLDLNPESWRAWWFLGKAHQTLGENQEAYDALRTAFDLESGDPNVAREFMKECLELGHTGIALEAAEHAVKLRPSDDGLVSNLALAMLFDGDHKAALKMAKKAYKVKKDPITKNLVGYIKAVMKGQKSQPRKFSDLR